MDLSNVRTETEFFAFEGGLDLMSPALRIPVGMVTSSQNYEPSAAGGYTRIKGYERFDGRPRPSEATVSGANTALEEATALVAAADVRRAVIAAPTGSGAIRGVVMYNGTVYAFRDNVGGTAGGMWKSTASGWVAVGLGEEVLFTNANVSVGEGDVLTKGAVTATVMRLIVETGSLASGVNTGRIVISGRAGGSFSAGAATSTGGGTLTLSGAEASVALPAGGLYGFDIYNFSGQLNTLRLYGCNGVGKAFEFDGTTFAYINTGAASDTPTFIKAHRKYLYLAIGSSVMNSSIGVPSRFVAGEGATEIAVGDTVTGLCSLPGEALGVMARNGSYALIGSSYTTWQLQVIRTDVGAVAHSLQSMSDTYFLDDRGVTSVSAVQEYGNFADATLSQKIQPLIDAIRSKVVASYVSRQKGLYTLLMSDGSTLTMGILAKQLSGFLQGQLLITPSCAWSGEDSLGIERVFLGASDGMVYEIGVGSTFDGQPIQAMLKLAYHHSKSPRVRKRYRSAIIEMSAELYSSIQFKVEYSYGDPTVGMSTSANLGAEGAGGSWDFATWDSFFWDGQDVNQPKISLEGTGINLALVFYSNTTLDFGHTLQGAVLHYTLRRQER